MDALGQVGANEGLTYVKERLSLFGAHLCVGIAEHESDCREEITLARSVAPNDYIVLWGEGLDDCLIFVAE